MGGVQRAQFDFSAKRRAAEDNIPFACTAICLAGRKQDVFEAICIDVASGCGRKPAQVAGADTVDPEPISAIQCINVLVRAKAIRLAKDNGGNALVRQAILTIRHADDDIVKAVTIDIASTRSAAKIIARDRAGDAKSVGSV